MKAEIWFKITDFTLLEHGSEKTVEKLAELYIQNDYMDLTIDEISPFTTGVKYPAIIQDLSEEQYFDESTDEGPLIFRPNPGLKNNEYFRVLHNLNHYVFEESLYRKLPHAAKLEIESAELDIYEHNYRNIIKNTFSYIKALEIIINDLTIHHIKRKGFGDQVFVYPETMPPKLYFDDNKAGVIPITQFPKNYSLGQLMFFMERGPQSSNFGFKSAFKDHKQFVRFMTKDFKQLIEDLQITEIRGQLAHGNSSAITKSDALLIRKRILGLGCNGLIQRIYQSFYPNENFSKTKLEKNYDNKVKAKKAS